MASSLEYRSIVEQQKRAAAECGLGLVRDVHLSSAAEAAILATQALARAPDGHRRSSETPA
jgi:hypothetical protein